MKRSAFPSCRFDRHSRYCQRLRPGSVASDGRRVRRPQASQHRSDADDGTHGGFRGRSEPLERLLRGLGGRRGVAEREPRQRLDVDLRQRRRVQHVLHADRSEGLERPLGRHGRELEPAQRDDRRRPLQDPPTPARRGRASASRTPSTSATWRWTRAIRQVVYVAAQGPLWSAGGDRGIYKTTDGGKTWKQILHPGMSADTGGNEIHIDPNNPDVLYASTWQRRRGVGQMIGGGPESAIYKSINGGAVLDEAHEGPAEGRHGPHRDGRRSEGEAHARLRADQRARRHGFLSIG